MQRNFRAVDLALDALHEVDVHRAVTAEDGHVEIADGTPDLIRALIAGRGDALPVSALPVDGTFPSGTARFEKRNLADELPIWDESICIDCAKCALVCPHAAIRMKVFEPAALEGAPAGFKSKEWRAKDLPGMLMTIQVSPDDCTGCRICIETCPAKDKSEPEHKSLDSLPKARARRRASASAGSTSSPSPRSTAPRCSLRPSRARRCSSRCSSSPAPAPAAARRRTSSC